MSTRNVINSKFYEVAQGDINGNITGLATANLTANANVSLGNISNVHITGGTSGQFIQTNGNGNLTFANVVVRPGGSNTQVQFNSNGAFGGDANFTYNTATDQLSAPVIEAEEFSGINATFSNIEIDTLANLGGVNNVRIYGGNAGQVLTTNGNGGVTWANASGGGVTQPYVLFTATGAGNNQTFTSAFLNSFPSGQYCIIFKNGVSLDPSEYTVLGNLLTVNNYLRVGDSISVAPTGGGGGGGASTLQQVLFFGNTANLGMTLTGTATYTGNGSGLTNIQGSNISGYVANATHANIADAANSVAIANVVGIGNIANINLNGNSLQFLAGNGSWSRPAPNLQEVTSYGGSSNANIALSGANISLGSVSNVHVSGGSNNQFLRTDGNGNLSFANAITQIPNLQAVLTQGNTSNIDIGLTSNITANTLTIGNIGSNSANLTIQGRTANVSSAPGNILITAGLGAPGVSGGNISLIAGNASGSQSFAGDVIIRGGIANSSDAPPYNTNGTVRIQGNSDLGNISNIRITGGLSGQFLSTDGSGNLSFSNIPVPNLQAVTTAGGTSNANIALTGERIQLGNAGNIQITGGELGQFLQTNGAGYLQYANIPPPPTPGLQAVTDAGNTTTTRVSLTGGVSIANVSNITIGGGTTGQVLTTNGFGGISWGNAGIAGSNLVLTRFNETVVTANVSGTVSPSLSQGSIFKWTLTGNITIANYGGPAGSSVTFILTQGSPGGFSLSSSFLFAGNRSTLSVPSGSIDILYVFYDGTNYYASLSTGYV